MSTSILDALMKRDGLSRSEAEDTLADARALLDEGFTPEEVLEELGLEPDYLLDLLD